ncbi:hypothetical protein M758_7G013100 [Ceratodon purpureus]|nr:hypothetical protein M758_7G013100 [Ceratodon purpureus]
MSDFALLVEEHRLIKTSDIDTNWIITNHVTSTQLNSNKQVPKRDLDIKRKISARVKTRNQFPLRLQSSVRKRDTSTTSEHQLKRRKQSILVDLPKTLTTKQCSPTQTHVLSTAHKTNSSRL